VKHFQLGILGVTGSGKSYLTQEIIKHINASRSIVIDDLMQITPDNYQRVHSLDEFIFQLLEKDQFKIIVSLEDDSEYYDIFAIIWHLNNLVLTIDELSLFCDPYSIPESLRNITQRGRLKNISLIWNTQRPANISRNISTQTEFVVSFKLYEFADLSYFQLNKNKIEKIINLDKNNYEYVIARGDETDITKRLNNYKFFSQK